MKRVGSGELMHFGIESQSQIISLWAVGVGRLPFLDFFIYIIYYIFSIKILDLII